jgi:hypothetical protein
MAGLLMSEDPLTGFVIFPGRPEQEIIHATGITINTNIMYLG